MSQEFFKKTLEMLRRVDESPQIGQFESGPDRGLVITKQMSDGAMKVIRVGNDYTIVLHPDLIAKLSGLQPGDSTRITDETNTTYQVTNTGDKLHFENPRAGVNCVVDADEICDEQLDELSPRALGKYVRGAADDITDRARRGDRYMSHATSQQDPEERKGYADLWGNEARKEANRRKGIKRATDRLALGYPEPGDRWDQPVYEGTWSIPDTPEKIKGLVRLLSKPLHADAATHALYNYIGDDDLFDRIENEARWMDAEGVRDRDIRDLVISWIKQNADRYDNDGLTKVLKLIGESSDQLDELSPSTLGSYIGRAAHERGYHGFEAGQSAAKRDRAGEREHTYRGEKRQQGIERAASKLAGGPVNELSTGLQNRYRDRAEQELRGMSRDMRSGRDVDDEKMSRRERGLDRAARIGLDEVLSDADQEAAYVAAPGVKQAQTNANQAAGEFKQTAAAAQGAAQKSDAATAGLNQAGQKIDQMQAQQQQQQKKPAGPMYNAKPADGQYVIKKGDTLSAIAKANGVTLQQLLQANPNIKDPNRIAAGAGLNLPQKAAPAAQPQAQPQQAQPQQAAPQQGMLAQAGNAVQNWWNNRGQRVQAANQQVQQKLAQQSGTQMQPQPNAQAGVATESVTVGTTVKIETAPGTLSKARVVAINEGVFTVRTASGTEYSKTLDDLWVRRIVESAKPDFLDLDSDGNKKEPMKKAVKSQKKLKESVDLDAWMQEYNDNEDANAHSENILLVAELVGTPDQIQLAKKCIQMRDRAGYLPQDCQEVQANLQRKLWPKVRDLFTREYRKNKTMHEGVNSDLDAWAQEYNDNEENNYHSENILHIAKLVGSPNDIEVAQKCIAMRDRVGYLPNDASQAQQALYKKLWPKVQKMFTDEYKTKTMHEGDDVMAYTGPSEYETNQSTARELLQQARGWMEQGEDFGTVREILMAMVDDGAASPSDVKKVLAKINNELNEADLVGLGEKSRQPKLPRGPVVEDGESYMGKGNHRPGWMLKADPALGKKVRDAKKAARPPVPTPSDEWRKKEKVDELSRDTLTSYIKKASKGAQDFEQVPSERKAGVTTALKKKHGGAKVPATESLSEKVDLGEKAVSKAQQKFMGMVHAAQKGEKPASKAVADVAKSMKKGDVTDFAKTRHKGLPKHVDEMTTSGGVAVAPPTYKYGNEAKMSKVSFGDGVYEARNHRFEKLINETMNISVNIGTDPTGKPNKSINISATDDDAEQLSRILNLAGIDAADSAPVAVAMPVDDCGMGDIEIVDENQPDWPTNPETSNDPFQYSGGLNKPKLTGQTTGAPVNVAPQRGAFNENVELERTLFRLYQDYKGEGE